MKAALTKRSSAPFARSRHSHYADDVTVGFRVLTGRANRNSKSNSLNEKKII
ncbi:hypothetical protein [Microcoleus sp. B3-D7]|uniref:hypothetical protein n=1 Tax=Microcoleus sp. B3-D7 TaxID=2818659 RepID=UPI002FCFB14E